VQPPPTPQFVGGEILEWGRKRKNLTPKKALEGAGWRKQGALRERRVSTPGAVNPQNVPSVNERAHPWGKGKTGGVSGLWIKNESWGFVKTAKRGMGNKKKREGGCFWGRSAWCTRRGTFYGWPQQNRKILQAKSPTKLRKKKKDNPPQTKKTPPRGNRFCHHETRRPNDQGNGKGGESLRETVNKKKKTNPYKMRTGRPPKCGPGNCPH